LDKGEFSAVPHNYDFQHEMKSYTSSLEDDFFGIPFNYPFVVEGTESEESKNQLVVSSLLTTSPTSTSEAQNPIAITTTAAVTMNGDSSNNSSGIHVRDHSAFSHLSGYTDIEIDSDQQHKQKQELLQQEEPFKLVFPVPYGMLVPASRKVFQIMDKTAQLYKKVGQNVFQQKVEIPQQNNHAFEFLKTKDPLHPFWKLLILTDSQKKTQIVLKQMEEKSKMESHIREKQEQKMKEDQEKKRVEEEIEFQKRKLRQNSPDIATQHIISKAVTLVIQYGKLFESRLKSEYSGDSIFGFLHENHVYRNYFLEKLKEEKEKLTESIRISREKKQLEDEEKKKLEELKKKIRIRRNKKERTRKKTKSTRG